MIDSDNESSSDEEWNLQKQRRLLRPRIKDYAQSVVIRYAAHEFKSHFRYVQVLFFF